MTCGSSPAGSTIARVRVSSVVGAAAVGERACRVAIWVLALVFFAVFPIVVAIVLALASVPLVSRYTLATVFTFGRSRQPTRHVAIALVCARVGLHGTGIIEAGSPLIVITIV